MRLYTVNQSGVTLVELMTTTVIISILSVVMVNFLGNWYQSYAINQTRTNLLADAQNALDSISDMARLSSSADQNNRWQDPNSPGAPANQLSWQSSANTLVLASAVEDKSGSIVFSDASNYTSQKNNQIYFVRAGNLYRRTLAAPVANNKLKTSCPQSLATTSCPADKRLASNVSSFVVKYYNAENQEVVSTNARSVEVTVVLQKLSYKQQITRSYTTRMVFRND